MPDAPVSRSSFAHPRTCRKATDRALSKPRAHRAFFWSKESLAVFTLVVRQVRRRRRLGRPTASNVVVGLSSRASQIDASSVKEFYYGHNACGTRHFCSMFARRFRRELGPAGDAGPSDVCSIDIRQCTWKLIGPSRLMTALPTPEAACTKHRAWEKILLPRRSSLPSKSVLA